MRAQHAGLVYFDLREKELGRTVATFAFKLPLQGAPPEVLDGAVQRLFHRLTKILVRANPVVPAVQCGTRTS